MLNLMRCMLLAVCFVFKRKKIGIDANSFKYEGLAYTRCPGAMAPKLADLKLERRSLR